MPYDRAAMSVLWSDFPAMQISAAPGGLQRIGVPEAATHRLSPPKDCLRSRIPPSLLPSRDTGGIQPLPCKHSIDCVYLWFWENEPLPGLIASSWNSRVICPCRETSRKQSYWTA